MEPYENPFAAPRAQVDTHYVPVDEEATGGLSFRATDILRRTRPWVLFLGVIALLFMVLSLVVGAIALLGVDEDFALDDALGQAFVAVFYSLAGAMLVRYASRIKTHVKSPDEVSMIAALNTHRLILKTTAILALVVIGLYLLLIVGAVMFGLAGAFE